MFIHRLYHSRFKQFSTNTPIIRRFPVFLHLENYFDKLNNPTNDEEFC